jgi:hypothetical protein
LGKRSISKRITKKNNIMGSFMNKHSHASNLLKYNAVDDKASALNYNGKKKYDEFGTEIPEGFTVDSRTGKAKGVGAGVTGEMRTVNAGYQTGQPTFDDGSNIPKKPGTSIGKGGSVISSTGKGKKTRQTVRKLFTS